MNNQIEMTDEQLAMAVGGLLNTGINAATSNITATATNTNLASADQTNILLNSTVIGNVGGASVSQTGINAQDIQSLIAQFNS
jgi:hypothetical protein